MALETDSLNIFGNGLLRGEGMLLISMWNSQGPLFPNPEID